MLMFAKKPSALSQLVFVNTKMPLLALILPKSNLKKSLLTCVAMSLSLITYLLSKKSTATCSTAKLT